MKLEMITKKFKITEEEENFLKEAATVNPAMINQLRIMSEMYFSKTLENVALLMIESNEKLSQSSDKYSNRLAWFTFGLILVGVAQIVTLFVKS